MFARGATSCDGTDGEQFVDRSASNKLPQRHTSSLVARCELELLKLQQASQPFRLYAAYRYYGLRFVVHPKLVARFEPGNHFADTVDIHQIRAMHPPEKVGVEGRLQFFDRAKVA